MIFRVLTLFELDSFSNSYLFKYQHLHHNFKLFDDLVLSIRIKDQLQIESLDSRRKALMGRVLLKSFSKFPRVNHFQNFQVLSGSLFSRLNFNLRLIFSF